MQSIGEQDAGLLSNRRLAVFLRALVPVALLIWMLAGCATPTSYMGIDFANSSTSAEQAKIPSLAQRAQGGDKPAQLEPSVRFEEGRGTPVDLEKTEEFYVTAATDKSGASKSINTLSRSPNLFGQVDTKSRLLSLKNKTANILPKPQNLPSKELQSYDGYVPWIESDEYKNSAFKVTLLYDDYDAHINAIETLTRNHITQPVFQNLSTSRGTWQELIVEYEANKPLIAQTIDEALRLIKLKSIEQPGHPEMPSQSGDREGTVCDQVMRMNTYSSAVFRAQSLCVAKFPDQYAYRIEALENYVRQRLELSRPVDAKTAQNVLNDAIFFMRIVGYCNCTHQRDFDKLWDAILTAAKLVGSCTVAKCKGFTYFPQAVSGINFGNYLLENAGKIDPNYPVLQSLISIYNARWVITANSVFADNRKVGYRLIRLCHDAGYSLGVDPYRDCRTKYPFSSSVMVAMRGIAGQFFSEDSKPDRCSRLTKSFEKLEKEFFFQPYFAEIAKNFQATYCPTDE